MEDGEILKCRIGVRILLFFGWEENSSLFSREKRGFRKRFGLKDSAKETGSEVCSSVQTEFV
ncbi:hypothetical protein CH380_20965 [Leptospira adleri]|nr:hypothetical protein CH380_20965 [Leptospira adleri]